MWAHMRWLIIVCKLILNHLLKVKKKETFSNLLLNLRDKLLFLGSDFKNIISHEKKKENGLNSAFPYILHNWIYLFADMDTLWDPSSHDTGGLRVHHPLPWPQSVPQKHLPGKHNITNFLKHNDTNIFFVCFWFTLRHTSGTQNIL